MKCIYCKGDNVKEMKTPDQKEFASCEDCQKTWFLEPETTNLEKEKELETTPEPETPSEIQHEQPTVTPAKPTKKKQLKKKPEPKQKGFLERANDFLNKPVFTIGEDED